MLLPRLTAFLLVCNSFADTRLVLLGTGTPNADPERSGPAVAIVVDGASYLVDAGPGVVRRAAAAAAKGIPALSPPSLKRVFLSHLHSDHTLGLPDVMFTPWTLERTEPIHIHGPKGTRALVRNIENAWAEDRKIRLGGGEPSNRTGYRAIAHEIRPGVVYRDERVEISAIAVNHGAWKEAYGYRFATRDRVIVVSGDAAPSPALAEACNGCDILLHEVYSSAGFARRPPEWQRYHSRYHTSSKELADLAGKARPKLLVLYHQLFWGTSEADLIAELQQGYSGKVACGRDLDVF